MRFFATASKGTEPALRDELRELRLRRVRADRGGVHFEGEMADAARACLWSRVAVRILLEVATFPAADEVALYDGVRTVEWCRWMTPATTLAVRSSCRSSRLTHSQFVSQKTKDAIVDSLRDRFAARPSVDRTSPDVGVAVRLARDVATLYLDAAGSSLHSRGWRAQAGPAPLRENLAAAVLRLSGWDRRSPLIDPMCGAGTIAIEAAAWARNIAPGLWRPRFGFERWANHDPALAQRMREIRAEAGAAALRDGPQVLASDIDPEAVATARENAQAAGVRLVIETRDVRNMARPGSGPGHIVTNPPFGERLTADARVYDALRCGVERLRHHTLGVLAASPAIDRALRRAPDRWWMLYNGPIECRLLVYDL